MKYKHFLAIRGCDLDQHHHAKSSAYLNYIEEARWNLLRQSGTLEYFTENEILPAIIEISIRFVREAKIFDELVVETTVRMEEPYVVFDQVVRNVKTGRRCCKAIVKQIQVDSREKAAFELPKHILGKWGL